jgi:BirA family transcriptional regulator, biotin operon repressor / biotin---[acetyl-CoA-carboxylase] ligase
MKDDPWFDATRFERLRAEAGAAWGRPVRVLDRTESTNDLGLAAIAGDTKTGIVWVAREQTRGRGRRGSAWLARPGEALLMSTLLRWPAPAETTTGLGLAVGLAILRACQTRVPARKLAVKWPNDVVCEGAKLAGVLIESRSDGRGGVGIVVGLGVNVHARSFEPAAGHPTSLALLGAERWGLQLEPLLLDVLVELARMVPRVLSGQLSEVMVEVRKVDGLVGHRVRIVDREGTGPSGFVRGIADSGELELETPAGLLRIAAGHVELA